MMNKVEILRDLVKIAKRYESEHQGLYVWEFPSVESAKGWEKQLVQELDVSKSYKHSILDTWRFAEWLGEHYVKLNGCWVGRYSDQRNKDDWHETGELWSIWWEKINSKI